MIDQPDRSIVIRLSAQQLAQPGLLDGLDAWLKLGLLSDEQVRQLCQENLTCPLPESVSVNDSAPVLPAQQASALTAATKQASTARPPSVNRSPGLVARSLQAFMAEISVIWLLFLGVFLVVVSSGVLAASQWQNFSSVGQYGILFAYTLAFWGVSWWAARQQSLRLTARMLQIATLLIIPVNFWMIDGLKLLQSGTGVIVGAIASVILTAIIWLLLKPHSELTSSRSRLYAINSIGLSWLHWGWALPGIPLIATYIGTVGTALLLCFQLHQGTGIPEPESRSPAPNQSATSSSQSASVLTPATLAIAFATLLLIGRAVLGAEVPIEQLGLALGICGWLFCWLTRHDRARLIWVRTGASLLLMGWAVTVTADPPWQAIAVSGLGLWLLIDRLQRHPGTATLTAVFLVGLQTYCLLWQVIPAAARQSVIAFAIEKAGAAGMPEALLGLAGFPYLWLTLRAANGLRQQQQSALARQAEVMALILGIGLSLISLFNPTVRSINLSLSALTLAAVIWNRLPPPILVYLIQVLTLAAIGSWIHLVFPSLDNFAWATLSVLGVAIEWGLSIGTNYHLWRRSAWHLGLVLAGLSYALLLATVPQPGYRNLVWIVVPTLLTGLSCLRVFLHRPLAAWLSMVALLIQLPLYSSLPVTIVALAIATGLMLVNTHTLRHLLAASLTIGFALGVEATAIWQGFSAQLTGGILLDLLATNLWLLWLSWRVLARQNSPLRQLYAFAANGWAIGLCLLTLLILTFDSIAAYALSFSLPSFAHFQQGPAAAGLTTAAIAYRIWQQPTNLGFYGVSWGVEILAALLIYLVGGTIEQLAIANLGLGLLTQIAGDVWVRRSGRHYRSSWHSIPLLYAGLGTLLAHHSFTAYTGLCPLAAALVGIGVGRRYPALKPLTLLAVFLFSFAAYELLVYQLMQAKAGNPGDGVALLAGLAALIAWSERLLSRWLLPYLRLTQNELNLAAHLHWGLGSSLSLLSLLLSLSPTGTVLWSLITASLSAYALALGRLAANVENTSALSPTESTSLSLHPPIPFFHYLWTYAGIIEALLVFSYALYRSVPDTLLMGWAGAIASVLAVGLYFLPWHRWGWPTAPWHHSAIILPAIAVLLTATEVTLQSLLITAAFYAWLAKTERKIRLSYLSILLLDWAIVRFLFEQGWLSLLWFSVVVGGSLLYVAQVDPSLQSASAKEQRHWLRSLATGLICLTTFYQAEVETGTTAFWVGFFALGLGIGLVFLGLVLRVRAFLYIGTIAFVLRILRLLWLFINTYSLLLWAVGIVMGLIFIWIAATFEARRSQMNALLQYWLAELESWE